MPPVSGDRLDLEATPQPCPEYLGLWLCTPPAHGVRASQSQPLELVEGLVVAILMGPFDKLSIEVDEADLTKGRPFLELWSAVVVMVEQLFVTVDYGLAVVIIVIVILDLRIGQDDEPTIFVLIDLRHRGDLVVEHPHNFHANLDDPPIARGRDTVLHHDLLGNIVHLRS